MNNEEKILEMLAAMREDVKALDAKLDGLENKVDGLENKVDNLTVEVQEGFKATRSELVEAVEAVGRKVERLEGSVKDVETVTARNAFELQLIKGRA